MAARRLHLLVLVLLSIGLGVVPAAEAAVKSIAVVAPKGYTVVALGTNGKTASVKGKGSKASLKLKASQLTLHLIAPDGVYGGPVVFAKASSSKDVMGVKNGTKIGRLRVNKSKGFARPVRSIDKSDLASAVTAHAKSGVPIGANNTYGLVKSKSSGTSKQGNDIDKDGVPGAFDIDVNGNLVLNNVDGSSSNSAADNKVRSHARAAANQAPPPGPDPGQGQPGGSQPPPGQGQPGPGGSGPAAAQLRVFSNLKLDMQDSLNLNAAGVNTDQINTAMSVHQTLAIQVASGDSVELNCTGLSYCSPGGTGKSLSDGDSNSALSFPACCDDNGNGFGTIKAGSSGDFQLLTGATSSQIGSGDTFIELVTSNGAQTQTPGTLNFAFVTTPALANWNSGSNSGTISYPVAGSAPGTQNNPFPVDASGDVVVNLTFWRPQRAAIASAGEGNGFIDIGGLGYTADLPNGPSSSSGAPSSPSKGPGNCPVASYTTSDPNLTVGSDAVQDQAADKPSDAANTLNFSINLTSCLASVGVGWSAGESLGVDIQARTKDGDNSAQKIFFKRK